MEKKSNKKTYVFLYLIVATIFLVVGIAMLFFDKMYLTGMLYVISSIVLYVTFYFFIKKLKKEFFDPMMNFGFILLITGLNIKIIGMWALGLIFFIGGFSKILKKEKE